MDILSKDLLVGYGRYSNFYDKRSKSLNIIKACENIRIIHSNTLGYFFGRSNFLYDSKRENIVYEICGDKFETSLYCILLEMISNNFNSFIVNSLCNITDTEAAIRFINQTLPGRLI